MSRDSRLVAIIFLFNLFVGLGYMSDTGRFIPPIFTDHLLLVIASVVFAVRTRGSFTNRLLLIVPAVFFSFYALQARETQQLIGEVLEMKTFQTFLENNHSVFKLVTKVSGVLLLLVYFVWMIDTLIRIRKYTRFIPLLLAILTIPMVWVPIDQTAIFIGYTVLSLFLTAIFLNKTEVNEADRRFALLIILIGLISLINLIFSLTIS